MEQSAYRKIFKGTAIFGGVQVVQLLTNLLKGKAVAILIGVAGMGVNSLYASSMQVMVTLSGLGLKSSAVRDIAEANSRGDQEYIIRKLSVLNKCFLMTCIVGVILTICLSPILSYYSFKNNSHIESYVLLSLFVVFTLLGDQCTTVLQGLHLMKKTAQATMCSCVFSLIGSIVLYYFFGIEGIVYNIIITSFISYISKYYFVRKLYIPKVEIGFIEALKESKTSFYLGFVMVISVLFGNVTTFILNAYISNIGDVSDVGFFQAGIMLTTQSVALVFASLAADYYPKLVISCNNIDSMKKLVNEQGEIVCLISLPILYILMLFSPFVIRILFTNDFLIIVDFVRYLCIGVFLQAIVFSIGYISFAKGDRTTFFWLEGVWSNGSRLFLNIIGYYWGGLNGLAVSFILSYILYFIALIFVTNKFYGFVLSKSYIKVMMRSFLLIVISYISIEYLSGKLMYFIVSALSIFVILYAIRELNVRLNIKEFVMSKIIK